MNIDPLTVTVSEAIRVLGIGRTSFYSAISAGKIRTKKFGRRTLVEVGSLRAFVEALPSDSKSANSPNEISNPNAAETATSSAPPGSLIKGN